MVDYTTWYMLVGDNEWKPLSDKVVNDVTTLREVKLRLKALGYQPGDPGTHGFNYLTKAAVRSFQQMNGLERTGEVDYSTWMKLNSSDAIPAAK